MSSPAGDGQGAANPARPRSGARFVAELSSFDGRTAVYEGFVHLPEASHSMRVELSERGGVASVEGLDPGGTLAKAALALLKAAAKLPRGPDAGPPPRRVSRWRA